MPDLRKLGQTSNIVRFKLTKSSDGTAFTGLTSASSGLVISTICDNEATATAYTQAGSTIETITTLGTFAAPTTNKCRFKEIDATNHPGLYEFQFEDARFAVSNARRMVISVSGATGLFSSDYEIELISVDLFDAVRLGMTSLPNAAANADGGLPILSVSGTRLAYTVSTVLAMAGIKDNLGTTWGIEPPDNMLSYYLDTNTLRYATYGTSGTVSDAAATSSSFKTTVTQADDYWNDALLVFTSGNLSGQSKPILDYANTNGMFTFDEAFTAAPTNGSAFVVRIEHIHPITQIQSGLPTLAQILAGGDVDGYTLEETLKLLLASIAKLAVTNGGLTNTFRAADDSKNRITATVDGSGNRTAVTFDATG